jgi:glucose-6-phosphate dehydrogenase assembly protein OpcA
MENAMTIAQSEEPALEEVPFTKIAEEMARRVCQDSAATPMRALVATVVAVGPPERLDHATSALRVLGDAGTVRGILISEGTNPAPPSRVAGNTVALHGLKPEYVNNAVAALRLSSLPTVVWWRGGDPETLDGLARLAERVILDDEEPQRTWERATHLLEDSAFSDLRWARLTQWRALMAHFFDIPEVQAACTSFTRLDIRARDRWSAALFGAWMTTAVRFGKGFAVRVTDGAVDAPVEGIDLGNDEHQLHLCLNDRRTSIETSVSVPGHRGATRLVPLTDQALSATLTDELRIRARDAAFERAMRAVLADRSRGLR